MINLTNHRNQIYELEKQKIYDKKNLTIETNYYKNIYCKGTKNYNERKGKERKGKERKRK
tara:strand:- start:301 stop:480 length:180 start_codon:yes stop_codon:yes gene_type:complete